MGEKVFFPNQTIGAKVGNDGEFEFRVLGEKGKYGVASVKSTYSEKTLDWVINSMDVAIFDDKGRSIVNEDIRASFK